MIARQQLRREQRDNLLGRGERRGAQLELRRLLALRTFSI